MTGVGAWLREIVYGIGFLGSAVVGALLMLSVAGQIELDTLSLAVRAALGAAALAAAVYFIARVAEMARAQTPIQTMGSGGPISVSRGAVRSLVHDILDESFDIDDARVKIGASRDGLRISVRFSLPADQRIPEIGERIQADLRGQVEDRIGVTVDQVDVTAQAFKAASSKPEPADPKTAKEPTDLPEERDRVD